ncbi:MAG: hypothetical protein MI921_29235 [Cytophagales bacterium]|nr:hypothetical protein [Cytophagales bacterium]
MKKVAYHEAGHAILAFLLEGFKEIEVKLNNTNSSILGITSYNKDKFKSLMTSKGQEYGKKLIIVAMGGCVAEAIYQEKFEKNGKSKCQFGEHDKYQINKLLNMMLLSENERRKIEKACQNFANTALCNHSDSLENISIELLKRTLNYADISAIMRPLV